MNLFDLQKMNKNMDYFTTTEQPTMSLLCEETIDDTPPYSKNNSATFELAKPTKKRKLSLTENSKNANSSAQDHMKTPKKTRATRSSLKAQTSSCDMLNVDERDADWRCMSNRFVNRDWIDMYNNNATNQKMVGSGTHGRVYVANLAHFGRKIAVKQTVCGLAYDNEPRLSAAELYKDHQLTRLEKAEATIASFLTREGLKYCPNFCAVYGYIWGEVRISESRGQIINTEAAHMLMFTEAVKEDMHTVMRRLVKEGNAPAVFSLLIQVLMALATMSRYGISHNDLVSRNILVSDCKGTICYEYPRDLTIPETIEENRSSFMLKTHGSLAMIADFGLASQTEWLEPHDGDKPLLDCDPRIANWDLSSGTLNAYYYAHTPNKLRAIIPAGMVLESCEQEVSFRHPLRYTRLKPHERDVASLFTEVVTVTRDAPVTKATRSISRFALGVLKTLEQSRPSHSDEFITYISEVTNPKYVANFIQPKEIFEFDSKLPQQRFYELPTKVEAQAPRRSLRAQLGYVPAFNTIVPASKVLNKMKPE